MNDWPLWDVYHGLGLRPSLDVVKAPSARAAGYRVQWEHDWYQTGLTVIRVEPSTHQDQWDGMVYCGRHQSVKA